MYCLNSEEENKAYENFYPKMLPIKIKIKIKIRLLSGDEIEVQLAPESTVLQLKEKF